MIFISLFTALVLDRLLTQFHSFRQFDWFQDYADWMNDVISIQRFPNWFGLISLILPLLFVVWFLQGIFSSGLFGLFEMAFNVVVLYLCFGPKDLDQQIDDYLLGVNSEDSERKQLAGSKIRGSSVEADPAPQAKQVVSGIFTSAHRRIFACVFWFVVLGPIGAVAYRLIEQGIKLKFSAEKEGLTLETFSVMLGFLEWLSTRITVVTFMLSGNFEGAYSGYKKAAAELVDINETNQGILEQAGQGGIQYSSAASNEQTIDEVKKARGLVLRALVVWLLLSLVVTWL